MSSARGFVFHTGEGQTLSQLAFGFIFSPFLCTSHLTDADKDVCTCYTHGGTISSILGMTLKISHWTMKKLLKCWGFFEVWDVKVFFFFLPPCQYVRQSLCYLWTFSVAIRGEGSHRHEHYMMEICIIKVHLTAVSNWCTHSTGPFTQTCQCCFQSLRSLSLEVPLEREPCGYFAVVHLLYAW